LQPKRRDHSTSGTQSPQGDPSSALSAEVGVTDFTFIALWMAGSLAGVMTAALISQAPLFRSLMRRLGLRGPHSANPSQKHKRTGKPSRKPSPKEALPMLAEAIMGSSKLAVAKVFGPPPSAVMSSRIAASKTPTFWHADTWYYPMPRNGPLAMAIRFADDSARAVEFIRPPAS
jgi:hypothetical protein